VLPVPAPRSALADDLCHVAANRSRHHQLLPLDAAAADSPLRTRAPDARLRERRRNASAQRQAARASRGARTDPARHPDPARAYLLAHNSTALERDLALTLDIPIYGPDPAHRGLGTKSGSRELFALSRVPLPLGAEHIKTIADAVEAACRLRATKPELAELVIKLNEGVSGEGNAIIDLDGLPAPGAPEEAQLVEQRLRTVVPEVSSASTAAYFGKLANQGGVVEERITGTEVRTPSVQLEITAHGEEVVLSTHDQILDGKSGQRYVGCRFPPKVPMRR
jgi:hypothetical protein